LFDRQQQLNQKVQPSDSASRSSSPSRPKAEAPKAATQQRHQQQLTLQEHHLSSKKILDEKNIAPAA
jgi:hypothetical protein